MSIEMIIMNPQRSDWSSEDVIVQHKNSSTMSKQNNVTNESKKSKLRSMYKLLKCCSSMPPLCQGLILGIIIAGLLLVIVIVLWVTSMHVTSTTTNINTQVSTTAATTTTETTSTSTTATSSTSVTSSTSSSTSTTPPSTTSSTATTSTATTTTASTTTSTTSTSATTATTTSPSCSSPSAVGQIFYFVASSASTTYTLYTSGFTASTSSATLTFALTGDSGPAHNYWLLDSISVNHTNADTEVLINGGFDTGDFTGWTQYCATDANCGGTGNYGQVTTSNYYSGTYCYVDKCAGGFDYLTQSFTTVIGDYYLISFYLRVYSSGSGHSVYVTLT